ncbi:AMP nucleosidase [Escherichia coli]|nr:AMP nucleosidase [Escherichia coli]EFB2483559.1 AMP nucleosidase [Escherichia coli]EFC6843168.1 AMP nucleosidase [Escherichia coli]EFD5353977.1 AMP nucleosidase [Escherichia coli]EFO2185248.1 AMP nucleosidase [Escherichia coli]
MIWSPESTDKTFSKKTEAVHLAHEAADCSSV